MQYSINQDHLSANQDHRIRFLVIHYTAEEFAASLDTLTTDIWPDPEDVQAIEKGLPAQVAIASLQEDLKTYGYNIVETGALDEQTKDVVLAFHMHFMGIESPFPDQETHATIKALLKKYVT